MKPLEGNQFKLVVLGWERESFSMKRFGGYTTPLGYAIIKQKQKQHGFC